MQLPEFLRSLLMESMCEKMSIGFSNVPGPKKPWVVGGKAVDTLGFFMPVGRTLCASISICSHASTVKVGVVADKAAMKDPHDLLVYFENNLDQMLGVEWREYDKRDSQRKVTCSATTTE